jgi:surface antigen
MALTMLLLPSNQLNKAAGDPDPSYGPTYEQDIWYPAAVFASDEFARQGHIAIVEFVRGQGTATVDELGQMCDRGVAWLKGQSGDKRVLSFHSNAGSGTQYMYPLIGMEASRAWSQKVRDVAITYTGFKPRAATVRSLMFFSHFNYLGANHQLLMEIGEHQTIPSAQYLYTHREYLGRTLARSVIVASGYTLKSDGPMALGVPVPPGHEKYQYVPPPVSDVVPVYTRLIKLTSPYMRGDDVKWVQRQLTEWGYKPLVIDSVYGPNTATAVKSFQAHKGLVIDGKVGPITWAKLATV